MKGFLFSWIPRQMQVSLWIRTSHLPNKKHAAIS